MKLYRVNNEDEYNWIMQKLENEGYLLGGKSKPTSQTYEEHLEQFSDGWDWFISAEEDSRKVTNYGTREEKEDNEIIEASELMPQKTDAERSRGMKFKIGDKARVKEKEKIHRNYREREDLEDYYGKILTISDIYYSGFGSPRTYIAEETGDKKWYEDMLEPIHKADAEVMPDITEGRNSKPVPTMQSDPEELEKQLREVFPEDDPIKPKHYENNGKDLFDELYDRLYYSKKMFTGREVFIIVMKFVAERYTRRYPNKNAEDLGKGIYTLERLKEYEENTK